MKTTLYVSFVWLLAIVASDEVAFKNVEFKGYSVYTLKFKQTITSSDTLKGQLPQGAVFDHLEFIEQRIPVLKRNCLGDIEVDELTLQNCELATIEPGAFNNLSQLRKLNLRGNRLEHIKAGVFDGLQLSMLDLGNNSIRTIEADALNEMPNLLNINLADNLIETWNKRWFQNVPLLTRVSMQNNSLQTIAKGAFTNLNGNKNFGSVKLSINLIFSYNKISRIEEGAFEGLDNINNLWLDNNNLTEFSDKLLEGVDIQDLRIEHNQIGCLRGDLGKIIKARTTHMDGNPFDCLCLGEIKAWAKTHGKNVDVFYSDMNCIAERLKRKMIDLENKLKGMKDREDTEPEGTSPTPDSEIEVIF